MIRFLHLSDLHIRGDRDRTENRAAVEIVNTIIARHGGAADKPAIIITGDIVDDGRADQFAQAAVILRPLVRRGFRLLLCPGNHDYGRWGLRYEAAAAARYRQTMERGLLGGRRAAHGAHGARRSAANARANNMHLPIHARAAWPRVCALGEAIFIGLDSMQGNRRELVPFASGELGARQLARLGRLLDHHAGRLIVVYLHHHPFLRDLTMELDDARAFRRLIHGRIDALLFGHRHVAELWFDRGGVPLTLASGKTTEPSPTGRHAWRDVEIEKNWARVTEVRTAASAAAGAESDARTARDGSSGAHASHPPIDPAGGREAGR